MTEDAGRVVVVGLGNRYRRDDGVGVAVAAAVRGLAWPNVVVTSDIAEPTALLEAWTGAGLAVIIDAAVAAPANPGRIHRYPLDEVPRQADGLSSHGIDVGGTHALARALGRAPGSVVVIAVEAADTGDGEGLSPPVARAAPLVAGMVAAEINRFRSAKRLRRAGSR